MSHVEPERGSNRQPEGEPNPYDEHVSSVEEALPDLPTMRTTKVIENEITALQTAMAKPGKHSGFSYNADTRKVMAAQIRVLTERMTPAKVEAEYYVDESGEDYRDGDNDLWSECDRTARWLAGDDDYPAPSAGL